MCASTEAAPQTLRHTFRHTAAAWLMQRSADKFEVAGYLGMTMKTLEPTYGHHHPDYQTSIGEAFARKKTMAGWRIVAVIVAISKPAWLESRLKKLILLVGGDGFEPPTLSV